MKCTNCEEETINPKFCSRSCAAQWTNRAYPKRKTKNKCLVCNEPAKSYRHYRCEIHWEEYLQTKHKNKTIGEYRQAMSVRGKHPSWYHAHVRNFARSWLRHLTLRPCQACGYDKHVELAHIKPVSGYPDTALLSEVNSPENVIPLCRNCHWEFDNLPRGD